MKLLSFITFCFLFQTGSLPIESLVSCLMTAKGMTVTKLNGHFAYYESNAERGIYKSVFAGNDEIKIRHIHFSGGIDSLVVNEDHIALPEKYDALSIKCYKLAFHGKNYLCLLGSSVSASGTGSQVIYYTLLEMSKSGVKDVVFLDSRFGGIGNIGDVNSDGRLDFLKISNTGSLSDKSREVFKAEACTVNGKPIGNNAVTLEYLGNNNFSVLESKWFFKVTCR